MCVKAFLSFFPCVCSEAGLRKCLSVPPLHSDTNRLMERDVVPALSSLDLHGNYWEIPKYTATSSSSSSRIGPSQQVCFFVGSQDDTADQASEWKRGLTALYWKLLHLWIKTDEDRTDKNGFIKNVVWFLFFFLKTNCHVWLKALRERDIFLKSAKEKKKKSWLYLTRDEESSVLKRVLTKST